MSGKDIINLIKEHRGKMTDKELSDLMTERYPKIMSKLTFGKAANIDCCLNNDSDFCGGYWRQAYDFPKPGDKINGGVVSTCGFFTFDIDYN